MTNQQDTQSQPERCLYLERLGTADYIPVYQCPCSTCKFSTEVYDLEQHMTGPDGELDPEWASLDLRITRRGRRGR